MSCHFFFQGIFLTQGLNQGLLHCRQILYHLSHQGSPSSLIRDQPWVLCIGRMESWPLDHQGSPKTLIIFKRSGQYVIECPLSLGLSDICDYFQMLHFWLDDHGNVLHSSQCIFINLPHSGDADCDHWVNGPFRILKLESKQTSTYR